MSPSAPRSGPPLGGTVPSRGVRAILAARVFTSPFRL
jgi:hypothetical protein